MLKQLNEKLGPITSFFRPRKAKGKTRWGMLATRFLFFLPLGALWLVFDGYPFLRGLIIPFQDYQLLNPESWSPLKSFCGLANFVKMFKDHGVWYQLREAALLLLSWFPITLVLSLFMAVVLSKIRAKKLSVVYRVLITLPWIVAPVLGFFQFWLFDPEYGYLSYFLSEVLKIWKNPPAVWISPYTSWRFPAWGITITWQGMGFYMLLFLIGLYNIPQERYEAARLDGANAWQEFWHVSLPGIRNIIFLFLLFNAVFLGCGLFHMMQGIGAVGPLTAYGMGLGGYGATIMSFSGVISLFFVGLLFKFLKLEKA